ncbi:menaquinone-dependent protoporphyrinogen IX dehydrogenase [Danxiaibacter flavus]|uniref:Menaquinone-dependent protoporphyrinogen IX dehydrogenase n=1 Tax=Danxiaibacter flavus TaxID=3049108 RepID=A0ABV3ZHV6_9BACT|nr:menaquinone-dependent protoporphyrinogen IX dehydrogenase [Chitinophagaceae bacterium DXS]
MKLLIVYGTTEGQTRKIARFIESALEDCGHHVTIADASDDPPPASEFDAVLIGASIHIHSYQPAVAHYVRQNVQVLNQKPSGFFSVCLAVASDLEEEHREAEKIASDFLIKVSWSPKMVGHFAGALKYTQYDFFKRLVMKMIAKREGRSTDTSQDYEYTNWDAVKAFAMDFAGKLEVVKT